jgi:dCTP deaminase
MSIGTLSATDIRQLVASGAITSRAAIDSDQIQPASLDLMLGAEAWLMPGSMLPRPGERIRDLIDALAIERISLSKPCCLVKGATYWVRLREHCRFDAGLEAYTNNKSSTGRIDVSTRCLSDGSSRYDRIAPGYEGDLWLEICSRSFDVVVNSGLSLNQAIFFRQRRILDQADLRAEHAATPLLYDGEGRAIAAEQAIVDDRLVMTADLAAERIGYTATRSHRPLALHQPGSHDPGDFFAPIPRPASGYLFLEKDHFYILATCERVRVPADLACEMVPYHPASGEFRAHYAGFFDPGFGVHTDGAQGTSAVLEIRPHEDDLILRHGQPICAMAYERLSSPCTTLYGGQGSHYARQTGPRLSKYFRSPA